MSGTIVACLRRLVRRVTQPWVGVAFLLLALPQLAGAVSPSDPAPNNQEELMARLVGWLLEPVALFADGFESGNATHWSAAVP